VPYNFESFPSLEEITPMDVMLVLVALGLYAPPAEEKFEKHADIAYRTDKDADKARHALDVYVPKGKKDFPVVLFVHGGSWKSGNKVLYAALGQSLAADGIGCVICNYRLSPAVQHPAHVEDVAKAFAWVKANCGEYGGSKDKLFVSGHSAGGHLVALLGTDETYLKAEGCTTRDVCGVMAISGVYTITPLVLGDIFGKDEAVCKAASPITHVKGHHPPFLIAYGNKDFPFLDLMAEEFGKKLKECKNEATVMKLDRNHFSIIIEMGLKADDPLTRAMVAFMTKK